MLVLGLDHHTTDAATLARLSMRAHRIESALRHEPTVRGVVMLATCARLEAYIDTASFHAPSRAFVGALGLEHGDPRVRGLRGLDALEHLFRVSSGLESAVVGETQITGQVRDALAAARAHGHSTRSLDVAFENAIRVSRQARPHLQGSTSIVGAALDRVGDRGDDIGTAVVIGTGSFAQDVIAALRTRGAHTVWVHSPSGRDHLPAGADSSISPDELVEAIALGDITVAASGHGPVVVSEDIARAARALSASPLVLIDLSASGDIALSLDEEADVLVVRLDDVHQQDAAADRADACVRREARALHPRIESSAVDDLIVAVRRHVEEVAAAEIGSSADPALAEAVRRVTQALLHEPTQRARRAAAEGELERYRAALETVLGVSTSTEAAPRVTAGSAA